MTSKPRVRHVSDGVFIPVGDGLQNVVSSLGTRTDKRSYNRFSYGSPALDWAELEGAYTSAWLARKVVQIPVDDALREGRTINTDRASEIEREERRVEMWPSVRMAGYWSRLYGGAIILMVTDQRMDAPLDVNRIRKGSLKRLIVLDRWDISAQSINMTDPTSADYLKPEWYTVYGGRLPIHHSHVIRFDGEPLPRRMRALNDGWGDSVLRKMIEDLRDAYATKGGISSMVLESNVDVIQRTGLGAELASDQEQAVMQRFALANTLKSMQNMLLLDGEEEYQRKELSFSGLADILDRQEVWTCGAADIPATRLFGRSPAGMNATGDSDLKNYYDSVGAKQESDLRPCIEQLDEVMVRSALGFMPDDYHWEWNPLYQESGTELAQQELAAAQTDDIRLQQGVVQRHHVAERLRGRGSYAITDEDIDEMKADAEEDGGGAFSDLAGEPDDDADAD